MKQSLELGDNVYLFTSFTSGEVVASLPFIFIFNYLF